MRDAVKPAADAPAPLSEKAAEALVDRIARTHFGQGPKRLRRLGGGLTNAVFAFRVDHQGIVVRVNANATKIQDFQKEHWAMDRAREAGVPTALVFEVANDPAGPAYMIESSVNGVPGHEHPDRIGIVEQLGHAAQCIHSIRTQGGGTVFDWSKNTLSRHETWAHFLDSGLKAVERVDYLARRRMISGAHAEALLRTIATMRRWRRPMSLQHGDLRLKNTLVDADDGTLRAVVDWENCLSGPPPFWDFSIALHDLGVDLKEAFLRGYGLTPRRYMDIAPYVNALNVLNYSEAVRRAQSDGNLTRLHWLRARLHGWFDLHRLAAA